MEQVSLTGIENLTEAPSEDPATPGGHRITQSHASM